MISNSEAMTLNVIVTSDSKCIRWSVRAQAISFQASGATPQCLPAQASGAMTWQACILSCNSAGGSLAGSWQQDGQPQDWSTSGDSCIHIYYQGEYSDYPHADMAAQARQYGDSSNPEQIGMSGFQGLGAGACPDWAAPAPAPEVFPGMRVPIPAGTAVTGEPRAKGGVAAPVAVPPAEAEGAAEAAAVEADKALVYAMAAVLDNTLLHAQADLRQAHILLRRRPTEAKDAASALRTMRALIERLRGKCPGGVMEAVKQAGRSLCDVVAFRCRCGALAGDRESFLQIARDAFGGTLNPLEEAAILLAYQKRIGDAPDAFRSKKQRRGRPRKARPRSKPDRAGADAAAAATVLVVPTHEPMVVPLPRMASQLQQPQQPRQPPQSASNSHTTVRRPSANTTQGPAYEPCYRLFPMPPPSSSSGLDPWKLFGV